MKQNGSRQVARSGDVHFRDFDDSSAARTIVPRGFIFAREYSRIIDPIRCTPMPMDDRWLRKTSEFLERGTDSLHVYLDRLSKALKDGAARVGRYVWGQLTLLVIASWRLLVILSTLMVLVWFVSGFWEMIYWHSKFLRVIGWIGGLAVTGVLAFSVVVLFRPPSSERENPRSPSFRYVLIHVAALTLILVGIRYRYQFRSPVLRKAQTLSVYVSRYLRVEGRIPVRLAHSILSILAPPAATASVPQPSIDTDDPPWHVPRFFDVKDPRTNNGWVPALQSTTKLNMWVEAVVFRGDDTVLHLAVKTWDEVTNEDLIPADGSYLVDDVGLKYDLQKDEGEYGWINRVHPCKGDEICRFSLEFPPLRRSPKYLLLHHPQFEVLRMNFSDDPKGPDK